MMGCLLLARTATFTTLHRPIAFMFEPYPLRLQLSSLWRPPTQKSCIFYNVAPHTLTHAAVHNHPLEYSHDMHVLYVHRFSHHKTHPVQSLSLIRCRCVHAFNVRKSNRAQVKTTFIFIYTYMASLPLSNLVQRNLLTTRWWLLYSRRPGKTGSSSLFPPYRLLRATRTNAETHKNDKL
jgi:hypothetical protein